MTVTDRPTGLIPVLDLGGLVAGEPDAVTELAGQLERALTDIGFFFVVNHGLDWELVREVYDAATTLHALPLDWQAQRSLIGFPAAA